MNRYTFPTLKISDSIINSNHASRKSS